jgi:hypothetical protein
MLNVEVSSAKDIKGYYAHFCNWTQRIHHPLDPPDGAFPRIQSVHLLHGVIGPIENRTKILGTSRRRLLTTLWLISSFGGLVMRQG